MNDTNFALFPRTLSLGLCLKYETFFRGVICPNQEKYNNMDLKFENSKLQYLNSICASKYCKSKKKIPIFASYLIIIMYQLSDTVSSGGSGSF